jgi:hypothetical protein
MERRFVETALPQSSLTEDEFWELQSHGISREEAARQLELLGNPPPPIQLDRPCTRGDGIDTLDEGRLEALAEIHNAAARQGRCLKFVPASGAATRMFKALLECLAKDEPLTRESVSLQAKKGAGPAGLLQEFVDSLDRFAFRTDLDNAVRTNGGDLEALAGKGPYEPLLRALLTGDGLDYSNLPKGLLKFHKYPNSEKTPFEEHLAEAADLFKDAKGQCHLHFTVSAEHVERFRSLLNSIRSDFEKKAGCTLRIEFSEQQPGTDTLALNADGAPFRKKDGKLLFRPAGHGALLANMSELGADIIFLKNIDNVAPQWRNQDTRTWIRALTGRLAELQSQVHEILSRIEQDPSDGPALAEGERLLVESLHTAPSRTYASGDAETRRSTIIRFLDRPIRVCGMVRNSGEPGGGPFWVRDRDGRVSLQIVETSQIDPSSSEQQKILGRSTHFNPVFMACGLRDRIRRQYDLSQHIDPDSVIFSSKSFEGSELKALERPGLWNGSMADWNTVFVEVPVTVFNPVKTITDLLRPEHQPE